jgi:hypothetical protein
MIRCFQAASDTHPHNLNSAMKVHQYTQSAADFAALAFAVVPGRDLKLPVYQAFAFPCWYCG